MPSGKVMSRSPGQIFARAVRGTLAACCHAESMKTWISRVRIQVFHNTPGKSKITLLRKSMASWKSRVACSALLLTHNTPCAHTALPSRGLNANAQLLRSAMPSRRFPPLTAAPQRPHRTNSTSSQARSAQEQPAADVGGSPLSAVLCFLLTGSPAPPRRLSPRLTLPRAAVPRPRRAAAQGATIQ